MIPPVFGVAVAALDAAAPYTMTVDADNRTAAATATERCRAVNLLIDCSFRLVHEGVHQEGSSRHPLGLRSDESSAVS